MAAVHPLPPLAAALALVATILASSSATDSHVTYVSVNGSNTTSCLLGGSQHPCHNLSYVMEHLLCSNNELELHANYTVVITYSHVVSYHVCHISRDVDLTITGIGYPQLILSARDLGIVIFEYGGDQQLPGVNFTVIGIGFRHGGLTFVQISSLTFYNCTIQTGLAIYNSLLSFEHCHFTSFSAVGFHPPMNSPARMQIVNSTFIKILFIHIRNNVAPNQTFELSISDSVFTGPGGHVPLLIDVNCSVTVIIDGCHFRNYHLHSDIGRVSVVIVILPNINLSFNCTNSTFMNNTVGIIAVIAENPASIHIRNCTFQRNSPKSGSVIYIKGPYPDWGLVYEVQLTMDSVIVDDNTLQLVPAICFTDYRQQIVVLLQGVSLQLSDTTFSNNHGTALGLSHVTIINPENVSFVGNIGSSGGAVALLGEIVIDLILGEETSNGIYFFNNQAIFGGAIYVYKCAMSAVCWCNTSLPIHFEQNYATISGDSIYFEDPSVVPYFSWPLSFHNPNEMTTSPTTVVVNNPIRIFPGQKISFEANVIDYFNQTSSCIADAYLQCGKNYFCHKQPIRLKGGAVALSNGSVDTDLTIEILTLQPLQLPPNNIFLHMKCRNSRAHEGNLTVPLKIQNCPLGYKALHSDNATTCQCYSDEHIRCDPLQRTKAVCIQLGYWFGSDSRLHSLTAKCQFPFCTTNSTFCSLNLPGYVLLPPSVDDQCSANRGGLLCSSCRQGFNFTFQAVQCVPKDHGHCANWMPPTILLLSVALQFVLAFSLVVALRLKLGLGSGFLYGPLFYLAVINHLPFGYLKQFSALQTIISTYSSIFLLTMQVFGDIPWCFFDINPLLNFSFRFLGPLIVAVVLLLTVCFARRCPRLLFMLQDSPAQAMCLLILLSFWSLADTSLRLIIWVPLQSGEVSETRVALFPEMQYLQNPYHISLWIVSIVVLLFFVFFAALLAITPLLAKKYNMNKIKPLLDEFHSCYKDEYRWYSAVYFTSWLVLQIASPYLVIFLTLLTILLSINFIVRPYKNQWMDRMDNLLLTDLVLLTFLTRGSSLSAGEGTIIIIVLVYILSLAPLFLITIGGLIMITVRIKNVFKKMTPPPAAVRHQALPDYHAIERDRVPTQDVSVAGLRRFDEEREPLVGIMQQEDGDTI